ncbi:unnamed protein product [Trichobilharzia regenti]|nr:unnamed protein product [Trichobilharzia regenti]
MSTSDMASIWYKSTCGLLGFITSGYRYYQGQELNSQVYSGADTTKKDSPKMPEMPVSNSDTSSPTSNPIKPKRQLVIKRKRVIGRGELMEKVPELAKMSKEDVKEYRASLENIRVRGRECPKPLRNWVQAGISSRLLACLKR